MQGRARTQPTDNLSAIFWHIRTERDSRTRRSWQRRARQALATLDLTPAERHEVMAVWSRPDNARIDSPALRKLLGQSKIPCDWQTRPARSVTRARFDDDGQPTRAHKKSGSPRLDFGPAVNEPAMTTTQSPSTPPRSFSPCTPDTTACPAPIAPHPRRPILWPAPGDSEYPLSLTYGTRSSQPRPVSPPPGPTAPQTPAPAQTQSP